MIPTVVAKRLAPAPAMKELQAHTAVAQVPSQATRTPNQESSRVEMHAHIHPCARPLGQRLRERPADLVIGEDIALHIHAMPCSGDRPQHSLIEQVSLGEDLGYAVAAFSQRGSACTPTALRALATALRPRITAAPRGQLTHVDHAGALTALRRCRLDPYRITDNAVPARPCARAVRASAPDPRVRVPCRHRSRDSPG